MKILLMLFFSILPLFFGCTHFKVTQTETAKDGLTRATTTSAFTFFDSKSELAKLRAATTDKSQTTSVGSLSAESSGSNAVQTLRIVVDAAAKAAIP